MITYHSNKDMGNCGIFILVIIRYIQINKHISLILYQNTGLGLISGETILLGRFGILVLKGYTMDKDSIYKSGAQMTSLFNHIVNNNSIKKKKLREVFEISEAELEEIFKDKYVDLWISNPAVYRILKKSADVENARSNLFDYFNSKEKYFFNMDTKLHSLEKVVIQDSIAVLKKIISVRSEIITGTSALQILFNMANGFANVTDVSEGFILEFIHLFRAVSGLSGIYPNDDIPDREPEFISKRGRDAAISRSNLLDREEENTETVFLKYPNGLQADVIKDRETHKKRLLEYFDATEDDWQNYHWQIKHVIRKADTLKQIIELTEEEEKSIRLANQNRIPFGITPYYVSLMDKNPSRKRDHAVRAQVIPPMHYCCTMVGNRAQRSELLDFMGEHDTSPVPLVTRRYPQIAIIKPFNTCAQICVYCQRNWEINQVLDPHAAPKVNALETALKWFEDHPAIRDVLITGGDPLIMSDAKLDYILSRIAGMDHVQRIRIGTRTPVVLPQRITDHLVDILDRYHIFGKREVVIVTHFEHVWEITPEAVGAIEKIRKKGMGVYNQAVFTFENSRRFELVALRRLLRLAGVDPYYTFNAKGKDETRDYRVPIARLLQERKEEARLMPGMDRTDEPVFNVPRLGKNHLRAGQDRQILTILPDGRRVYEFLPWEKNIMLVPTYIYTDVSIFDYLRMLKHRGENIDDYNTIWYYY
jgi:lysine 2,3-aminomutase